MTGKDRRLRLVGDDERGPKKPPPCVRCNGSGKVVVTWPDPDTGVIETRQRTCPLCGGGRG